MVVADDNVDLRDLLRLSLELTDGIDVVGEAGDVASTLAMVEDLEPDVLLLDLFMPGRGEELDVVDRARRANPDMGIVVLTGWLVDGERDRVLAQGASEYLVKSPDLLGAVVPALLTAVPARGGADGDR